MATAELTNQNQRRESRDLEQVTQDMLVQLQASEVTLDRYCSRLVGLSVDCLSSQLSRVGVEGRETRSEATSVLTACLQMLASTVDLIEVSWNLILTEEDRKTIQCICSGLSHSLTLWRRISNKSSPGHTHDSTHHQLACRVAVCLACCLQRVLACADPSLVSLPCVPAVVRDLAMNGALMVAAPHLHRHLSILLDPTNLQVGPTNHLLLAVLLHIALPFYRLCEHLKKYSRRSETCTPV